MAIARPRLFTAISGTAGPVEFAQRGKTTIIRNRKKPKTKVTWRTIEAQREHARKIWIWNWFGIYHPHYISQWNLYAVTRPSRNRLGQSRTLSGFQYFMGYCVPDENGAGPSPFPPTKYPATMSPPTFWVTITAPNVFIVYNDIDYHDITQVLEVISYSVTLNTYTAAKRMRYYRLCACTYTTFDPYQHDYTHICTKRQLAWSPGDQLYVKLRAINTSREWSPTSCILVTVTAP